MRLLMEHRLIAHLHISMKGIKENGTKIQPLRNKFSIRQLIEFKPVQTSPQEFPAFLVPENNKKDNSVNNFILEFIIFLSFIKPIYLIKSIIIPLLHVQVLPPSTAAGSRGRERASGGLLPQPQIPSQSRHGQRHGLGPPSPSLSSPLSLESKLKIESFISKKRWRNYL